MTKIFEEALLKTLKFEGGYVNDPDDNGGETIFGISRKFHPEWSGWDVVDSIEDKSSLKLDFLKENEDLLNSVGEFYFKNFYKKIKCDKIEEMYPQLAINIFDFAVNSGIGRATKALQTSINELLKLLDKNLLTVDGIIGNHTLNALQEILETPNDFNCIYDIVNIYKKERTYFYINLTTEHNKYLKYLKGWIRRAFNA